MTKMKSETKTKLIKLAEVLYKKFGYEIIEFSNFVDMAFSECRLENQIGRTTIYNHQDYLSNLIKEMQKSKMEHMHQVIETCIDEEEIENIIIKYKSGREVIFIQKVVEIAKVEKIDLTSLNNGTGLFSYNDDEHILIRRGRYSGCNVKSKADIIKYFNTLRWFEKWSKTKWQEGDKNKITWMPDTKKDMDILQMILKSIDNLKNKNMF